MFARFCMLFSNLHGTTLFAFFVHVLYFNQIQTKRNETNRWQLMWSTGFETKHCKLKMAVDVTHVLHSDAGRLGVHVLFLGLEEFVFSFVFFQARGEGIHCNVTTCSDARHQRCLTGKPQVTRQATSQFWSTYLLWFKLLTFCFCLWVVHCFFDRDSVSAEKLLPGNSGKQAKTMTSFTLSTHHYPTVGHGCLTKLGRTVGWFRPIKKLWAGIFPHAEWSMNLRSRMHFECISSVIWRSQDFTP